VSAVEIIRAVVADLRCDVVMDSWYLDQQSCVRGGWPRCGACENRWRLEDALRLLDGEALSDDHVPSQHLSVPGRMTFTTLEKDI